MTLKEYKAKRNFKKTKEPKGVKESGKDKHIFVIQKHHASHLHYDLRLELDGVLKSWAVPKGPSLDPKVKRLAVEVEDHPVGYANFEGEIPKGEYGGGHVIVWDKGEWIPPKNVHAQLKKGHLDIELHGEKLEGHWMLLRTRQGENKKPNWLLVKKDDEGAAPGVDVTENDRSVISGATIEDLESGVKLSTPKKKTSKVKLAPKKKVLKKLKR